MYYNLFLRNWTNKRATEQDLSRAVLKGLLTAGEKEQILAAEQLE